MTAELEIPLAKEALSTVVNNLFNPYVSLTSENLRDLYYCIEPFSHLQPLEGGRVWKNQQLDFKAHSFWHACCAVLGKWITDRYATNRSEPVITAYRGQANAWPIKPSLWRTHYPEIGLNAVDAIKDFLFNQNNSPLNPTTNFFPGFFTEKGISAFAQHHEFPTSLIDFSFHPLVALYFSSRNCKPEAINDTTKGLGVIYECNFNNFLAMEANLGIEAEMVMLPPSHVFRIYQQRGFFVNCGTVPDAQVTGEIEKACNKIFFPRTYPSIEGIDDLFSEAKMIQYLANELDPFKSRATGILQNDWYAAYDYYKSAVESLKHYCDANSGKFNKTEAIAIMKQSCSDYDEPLSLFNMFGASKFTQDSLLAESISNTALFIFEAITSTGRSGRVISGSLLKKYAQTNPVFFSALIEIARRAKIFKLPEIAETCMQVNGFKEIIKGSLSKEQMAFLRNITEMHYRDIN